MHGYCHGWLREYEHRQATLASQGFLETKQNPMYVPCNQSLSKSKGLVEADMKGSIQHFLLSKLFLQLRYLLVM